MGNELLGQRNFNVTVYDTIMVVTAEGLAGKRLPQPNVYRKQYEKLLKDVIFKMQPKPMYLMNRMQFSIY